MDGSFFDLIVLILLSVAAYPSPILYDFGGCVELELDELSDKVVPSINTVKCWTSLSSNVGGNLRNSSPFTATMQSDAATPLFRATVSPSNSVLMDAYAGTYCSLWFP